MVPPFSSIVATHCSPMSLRPQHGVFQRAPRVFQRTHCLAFDYSFNSPLFVAGNLLCYPSSFLTLHHLCCSLTHVYRSFLLLSLCLFGFFIISKFIFFFFGVQTLIFCHLLRLELLNLQLCFLDFCCYELTCLS